MFTVKGYLPDNTYVGTGVYPDFNHLRPTLAIRQVSTSNEYRIPEIVPCFSQGRWGSCVLQSWVGALEILKAIEDGVEEALSVAWLYAQVRLAQGDFDNDTGAWNYLAADRIQKIGVVPEAAFPYISANLPRTDSDPSDFKPAHPPTGVYVEASDNKITTFYRINSYTESSLLDGVEEAVRANHPVIWAAPVSVAQITNWSKGDPALEAPEKVDGNHATVLCGVRRRSDGGRDFRVRNSWGTRICDNGYFWISDRYVAQKGFDFWAGTRMRGLLT